MSKIAASNYRIPGHNRVTLSDELANKIRDRFDTDRDNRFQLYLLAYK
jgi:putative cell wall-binding protein